MQVEVKENYVAPYRLPIYNLRWSAVLGGLIVGIAAELFLLLIGAALGLAFVNSGARTSEASLLVAASIWNIIAMVAASAVGGYVAARASGMRRTADGILHGVLAWGVAMLALLLVATSTVGSVMSEMMGGGGTMSAEATRPLDRDEREAIMDILTSRLGLSDREAANIADQIHMPGHEPRFDGRDMAEARHALRTASMLSGWLSAAILLSLVGAIGGGVLGSRSIRRRVAGVEARQPALAETDETGSHSAQ